MSVITKDSISICVVGGSGDVKELYITKEWRSIGNKKIAQILDNMIKHTVPGRWILILLEVPVGEMSSGGFLGQF